MKNLKNQPVFDYFVLFVLSILMTGCGGTKDMASVSQEISKHFGELHFTTATVSENNRTKLKTFKGKGEVKDNTGKVIETRWFLVLKEDGTPSNLYLGSVEQSEDMVVAMTEDEAIDELNECAAKKTRSELSECMADFANKMYGECILARGTPQEAEHCWFEN